MPRFPYQHTFGMVLIVLLAACTSASAPIASPTPVVRSVTSSPSTAFPAAQQTAAPSLFPLVDLNTASPGPNEGLRMRPVDPTTLADVPGIAPLDFAHHYVQTVSPDGRAMAAIIWPSGSSNAGGVLHLIDLTSWTDTTTSITFDDTVSEICFSPDGQSLYWAKAPRNDPPFIVPVAYELYRYDLGSRNLTSISRLPVSFFPYEMRLLAPGARLAFYGVPKNASTNIAEDAPHVLIIDLLSGRIVTDLRLDSVKAGRVDEGAAVGGEFPVRTYSPGVAWDRLHDRLYVVYPDVDTITVVDLARGVIAKQAEMRPNASLRGRIAGSFMPDVAAKWEPGIRRWAVVSNDGSRLYILGQRSEIIKQSNGQSREQITPTGLQMVDTGTLREVRRLDLPTNAMMLSPDGRQLLLDTSREDRGGTASAGVGATHSLVILDAERLTELGHSDFEAAFTLEGFSRDGRYAYLNQPVNTGGNHVTLRVFDLQARRVVVERILDGYFADLLTSRGDPTH